MKSVAHDLVLVCFLHLPEQLEDLADEFPNLHAVKESSGDIRRELHCHTTASDGVLTIEELIETAKSRGFDAIAITDHSRSSAQANGLSIERLREHADLGATAEQVEAFECEINVRLRRLVEAWHGDVLCVAAAISARGFTR